MGRGVSPLLEAVEDAQNRDLTVLDDILNHIPGSAEGREQLPQAVRWPARWRAPLRKPVERLNRRQNCRPGPAGRCRTAGGDEGSQTRSVALGFGRNEDAGFQALFARASSICRSSSAMKSSTEIVSPVRLYSANRSRAMVHRSWTGASNTARSSSTPGGRGKEPSASFGGLDMGEVYARQSPPSRSI